MASLKRRKPDAEDRILKAEAGKPFRAPLIVVVAAHCVPGEKIPEIEQVLAVGAAVFIGVTSVNSRRAQNRFCPTLPP